MKLKISVILISLFICVGSSAMAFLYEIEMLTSTEISRLSDKDLNERYIEAKIEEKASAEFHRGAGFSSAKEYRKRKQMLRYIFDIRKEMGHRESLDIERIDQYLK